MMNYLNSLIIVINNQYIIKIIKIKVKVKSKFLEIGNLGQLMQMNCQN